MQSEHLTSAKLWSKVKGLEGKFVYTLRRENPNFVSLVTDSKIVIRDRTTFASRRQIEVGYNTLWQQGELRVGSGRWMGSSRSMLYLVPAILLAAVPDQVAKTTDGISGVRLTARLGQLQNHLDKSDAESQSHEDWLRGRTDIGEPTRKQLIVARRGQGIFKDNVRLNEYRCRITGVTNTSYLIASHIKPWKDSSDEEKLDGCNGLLLAPHIDMLFDKGLISFSDSGGLLVSEFLDTEVVDAWGWDIDTTKNVGKFNVQQAKFLDYHRKHVFKR